ncbi:MAG: type IV toxin-antitoxin system AbiEi family antitoxin domain-containing protein [Cruoricaptor ignavus]|nr:type IV toxin-antitoxin system AbiEi family antitoxin domain-containing protein [Cruoricaptor ignavus]
MSLAIRNQMEEIIPEGLIVTRSWLQDTMNLGKHTLDNLVKSGYLKSIQRGIYIRGAKKRTSWRSIVFSLQNIIKSDLLVGGLTALELKGYTHYIPVSGTEQIMLYGDANVPQWCNEYVLKATFYKHSQREIFANMNKEEIAKYTISISWEDTQIKAVCPEMAILQVLRQVPNEISFEHAAELMQGMTSLSPRKLQALLEACTHIGIKRLFLFLANHYNYVWFTKLKIENIHLGSGKRMLVEGGELDKNYLITVPKNFMK